MLTLAADRRRMKATELAESLGTTAGFLPQVLAPLVAKGWVRSEPGPSGGYLATFDPTEVSVLAVIEAIEGPTDNGRCVLEDRACTAEDRCALHDAWARARFGMTTELARTTFDSLAAGRRACRG